MNIRLITDSGCDLPLDYITKNNIEIVPLEVCIKGSFIKDDMGQTLSNKDFYELLRKGEMPTTSQPNSHSFEAVFEKCVKEGKEVIYISLSSSLSGTYNSASLAKEMILEKYKEAKITLIDSLSVSLGQGLLVYYASEMLKEGKSGKDIIEWVEENKLCVNHVITIDDLNFLKRGGRISGGVAAIGGLLNIKPTLKIDEEGKLIPVGKIKGRKKVYKYLVEEVVQNATNLQEQTIFICHGDCLDEALTVKEMLLENCQIKDIIIAPVGVAIGAHGGPGTLNVIYRGCGR